MLGGFLMVMAAGGDLPGSSPEATPAAAVPEDDDGPDLRPESSVCQSVLNRPGPDDPQVFPAMYTQKRVAAGITIVANDEVSSRALDIAEETIERLFRNNDLEVPLAEQRAYVVVADASQGVLDLPEFGCLEEELGASFFTHVCGVADRADYPVATVNELDLLGSRSGPCGGLNILFHELGHLVQGWALEPADYFDIKLLYQQALDAGKYRRGAQPDYAATNPNEYFAEATQAYFLSLGGDGSRDREWLAEYDPDLYALLARVYGD